MAIRRNPLSREAIVSGDLPRAIRDIALPTWGAFLTLDMLGTVDMLFVGRLGAAAVAAVSLSGALNGMIAMLTQGVTTGTTALVASAIGRDDQEDASRVLGQSIVLAVLIGVAFMAVGVPFATQALRLMGGDAEVVRLGTGFLRLSFATAIVAMPIWAIGSALRGAGDARTPFTSMVAANIVNACAAPVFIYGLLGFPALGVTGSAVAALAGQVVAVAILTRAIAGRSTVFHLRAADFVPRLDLVRHIARIGIFASLRSFASNLTMIALMRLVATFGTVAVAAYGIGLRLRLFVFGPSMGFGTAAATAVGQNLGAGNRERARRAGWIAFAMCSVIVLAISLVFWLGSDRLVRLFTDDLRVVAAGGVFLRWFSFALIFLSLAWVLAQAMNGSGDTVAPMVVTAIASLGVGIPAAYGLAHAWGSVTGVWAGIVAMHVVEGLAVAAVFRHGRWEIVGLRIRDAALARQAAAAMRSERDVDGVRG